MEVHALSARSMASASILCWERDTRISTRPEMYLTRPLRKSTDNHARSSLKHTHRFPHAASRRIAHWIKAIVSITCEAVKAAKTGGI